MSIAGDDGVDVFGLDSGGDTGDTGDAGEAGAGELRVMRSSVPGVSGGGDKERAHSGGRSSTGLSTPSAPLLTAVGDDRCMVSESCPKLLHQLRMLSVAVLLCLLQTGGVCIAAALPLQSFSFSFSFSLLPSECAFCCKLFDCAAAPRGEFGQGEQGDGGGRRQQESRSLSNKAIKL
jgi:hypothetical protein